MVTSGLKGMLKSEPVQLAIAAVIVIGFLYYLTRKTVSDVVDSVANVNKGTPFEGFGVVGTAGNLANTVSGGTLAKIGSRIADYFTPDPGADVTYIATFPDGQRHAIASQFVDANGFFLRSGVRYRLAFDQDRKRIAVRI